MIFFILPWAFRLCWSGKMAFELMTVFVLKSIRAYEAYAFCPWYNGDAFKELQSTIQILKYYYYLINLQRLFVRPKATRRKYGWVRLKILRVYATFGMNFKREKVQIAYVWFSVIFIFGMPRFRLTSEATSEFRFKSL